MLDRDPKAGRRAVVENVHRKSCQTDHFGEAADDLGEVIEGVSERVARGHAGLPEAGKVGGDDMKAIGQ